MKIGDLIRHADVFVDGFRLGVVIKTQTVSNRSKLLYVAWTNGAQGWYYDRDLEALCE